MQTRKTEYTTLISIRPVSIAFIFMSRKLKVLKDCVFGIFFYLYYVENTEFSTFFVGVGGCGNDVINIGLPKMQIIDWIK